MNSPHTIISELETIDISNMEGVRFFPNNSESFSVSLDSIKRIAYYIIDKYEKVKFRPRELQSGRDFFVENMQSSLTQEDYKIIVDTLTHWVDT